jgi:purine-nucleoside phosphorylase
MTAVDPEYLQLQKAAGRLRPRLALILGSGLGGLTERVRRIGEVPFLHVPGLETQATVAGHRGSLLLGEWVQRPLLIFAGRLHGYEGYPWRQVVQPVHVARALGAEVLLTTNAAGGIRDDLVPGSLMVLRDHLDCTQPCWWRRREATSPSPYAPRLRELLRESGRRHGVTVPDGVYAQVTGPCYETPAEIRALRACGADAVGMSTAREIHAAAELGMNCAALSCITNRAAGLGDGPLCHDEVLATGRQQQQRLAELLETFLQLV